MCPKNTFYFIITVLMLVDFIGCTIIGLMVGSKMDKNNSEVKYPKIQKMEKIKADTQLKIDLKGDQYIEGRLQGLKKMDSSEYIKRYNFFRSGLQNKKWFPNINDTIFIRHQLKYSNYTRIAYDPYIFAGFNPNSIRLRLLTGSEIISMELNEFTVIAGKNPNSIEVQEIKNYFKKGLLPLESESLVIQTDSGIQKIPLDNILKLKLPRTNNWKYILGGIGLIADAVWIYFTVVALDDMFSSWPYAAY
jgi:hypothetical protein